ncbi:FAD/FMN-containing dehydrogenase [Diaminobutyricimonas aerilata]|uniref:FAD/FMN-containing dehydrogenase n=1 Tax=Diaminobutyricimonas aerilata TaxID=1162967 RepID=A0A2M9CNK5_9MICO|nr:FAD-binding oxidoreductase [Diaminobutyricimonas aerilata]PJJ73448.1 FAD/FMN-containing dehydrogenase [Diaminobutyricimonas aerilata]
MLDLIRPDDPRYPALQHVHSGGGAPGVIVRPHSAAETADSLALARDTGGPIAIRSGGHGISSVATNVDGTVIDLGALDAVERVDDRHVRVGAGARWGRVAAALAPWGLAISSGDSGDVGVGGLATAGGIGLLGRAHGLTIDHIVAAELVTADGRIVRVSADEHPDLYWAVRGAGANLGIVTSFVFRATPVSTVTHAVVSYVLADAAGFLERWGALVETSPRAISAFLSVSGGGTPFAHATIVGVGDAVPLDPFLELPGAMGQRVQSVPYATVSATTGATYSGRPSPLSHSGLADHLDPALSGDIAGMLGSGAAQMVQIRSAGGAINDVPADATAYAHRHQNFSVTAITLGDREAFDAGWEPLRGRMPGLYLSFEADPRPDDLERAYPAATLDRLRAIKGHWDPDRVFTQNFDVSVPA